MEEGKVIPFRICRQLDKLFSRPNYFLRTLLANQHRLTTTDRLSAGRSAWTVSGLKMKGRQAESEEKFLICKDPVSYGPALGRPAWAPGP